MVCKEEVLSWFKELESYKRIEVMCGLLNMCLPFELRFLGTYVEELGKRDFQELRGAELRANNPDELAADLTSSDDPRGPRKMALYVSLLRSCNAACAARLHRALQQLCSLSALSACASPPADLDELLLLYGMALHHPAFTFDQRSHFGEVLARLQQTPAPPPPPPPSSTPSSATPPPQHISYVYAKPPHHGMKDPNELNDLVNSLPNAQPFNESQVHIITDRAPLTGYPMQPCPVMEYSMPEHWPNGPWIPGHQEIYNYQQSASPVISQPSSPCDSRPVSPNLQVTPSPLISQIPRIPAPEMIAIPLQHEQHHQTQPIPEFLNLNITNQIRPIDDEQIQFEAHNPIPKFRQMKRRNGEIRPLYSNKPLPTYTATRLPKHHQSSESGSNSSTGGHTPPDTPALLPAASIGPGRPRQPSSPLYLTHSVPPSYPVNVVYQAPYPAHRHGYTPLTTNGEGRIYMQPYTQPYTHPAYNLPIKLTCFNCGKDGHPGEECVEPSMEEVTRAGGYQLDYSSAPPDINDK